MASAVTGAMKPLLVKLATLLEKKCKLPRGTKKHIASLRNEMNSMNALLVDLSMVENLSEQQKDWREKVRDLSYDMEDCIDIFTDGLAGGCAEAGFLSRLNDLKARYKVASRIKELKARAMQMSDCQTRYVLGAHSGSPHRPVIIDPRLQALYEKDNSLVGINGPKTELIKMLNMEDKGQRKVVAVVGSAGMGKSTLVSEVYDEIGSKFEWKAFMSISQNTNIVKILSDINLKLCRSADTSQSDLHSLIPSIRSRLEYQRYLIVLDDLWTVDDWNIIRCIFVESNCGSRVITTTCIENVATACCSTFHGSVYKIKPLNDLDARRLFCRRIFHSEDACPKQLNNVCDEILEMCGGWPLAIRSVASILASHKEVNSMEIWENMQRNLALQMRESPAFGWMRYVFDLGYNNLSPGLKNCMLYLGIFSEGSQILKFELVNRWIAEGLITDEYGFGSEEITAKSYFNELLNNNMIQIADFDDCGDVLSCGVHSLMLEFIILKSREENFITVMKKNYDLHHNSADGRLKVRRLSLHVGISEGPDIPGDMVLTQVRSFNFWGPFERMPSLSRFQLLRVLHLDWNGFSTNKILDYDMSICTLFQLRYLTIKGFSGYECYWPQKIMPQLRELQNLRSLEIMDKNLFSWRDLVDKMAMLNLPIQAGGSYDVHDLPSTLERLVIPDRVELRGCCIDRMKALRVAVVNIHPNDKQNIKGLGELSNLRELILIHFSGKWYKENSYSDVLVSSLCRLHNLESLTIHGYPYLYVTLGDPSTPADALIDWLPPPSRLRRLHVLAYPFETISRWITQVQLRTLRSLEVAVLSLPGDSVEGLAMLPSLLHLRLHVKNHAAEEGVVIRRAAFPNLEQFVFRCKVICLMFEAGAMPRIQNLTIQCYLKTARQSNDVLEGLEHLGTLNKFIVDICEDAEFRWNFSGGGDGRGNPGSHAQLTSALWGALLKAISKHPGSPRVIFGFSGPSFRQLITIPRGQGSPNNITTPLIQEEDGNASDFQHDIQKIGPAAEPGEGASTN